MLTPLLILSFIFAPPNDCHPGQTSCAYGCVPLGEPCLTEAERAPTPALTEETPPTKVLRPRIPPPPTRECWESDKELAQRRWRVTGGLVGSSLPFYLAGGLVLAFARKGSAHSSGPMCVAGKPCGNTCIAVTDTCHVGSGSNTVVTRNGLIAGSILLSVGVALTIAGALAYSRVKRRVIDCDTTGCRLTLRF